MLILGEPSSGKSSVAAALLHKNANPSDEDSEDRQRSDFAFGYDWADVRDDADEGEHFQPSVTSTCPTGNPRVFEVRYPCKTIRIYRTLVCTDIYRVATTLPTASNVVATYSRYHRFGLDQALDIHRRALHMAQLDRDVGSRRYVSRDSDCP